MGRIKKRVEDIYQELEGLMEGEMTEAEKKKAQALIDELRVINSRAMGLCWPCCPHGPLLSGLPIGG